MNCLFSLSFADLLVFYFVNFCVSTRQAVHLLYIISIYAFMSDTTKSILYTDVISKITFHDKQYDLVSIMVTVSSQGHSQR